MTFALGLTGSIGMGKSTTARMFQQAGCALWDADEAVRRLYGQGGAAVAPLQAAYPEVIEDHRVSRLRLKELVARDPDALARIEAIVHPLVAKDRAAFRDATTARIAVFDIPLLYEIGADSWLDAVACVTTSPETQRRRVMDRGTMTEAEFETILAKQVPDREKRARATYVIETDTLARARDQVANVIADIERRIA